MNKHSFNVLEFDKLKELILVKVYKKNKDFNFL